MLHSSKCLLQRLSSKAHQTLICWNNRKRHNYWQLHNVLSNALTEIRYKFPRCKKDICPFPCFFFFYIFSTVGKGCYVHYFDPLVSCQLQCTFTYFEKLNTVKWILTQKKKREDKRFLHNGKAQKRNILVILYNCLCKTPLNHYAILLRQAKQE